MLGKIMTLSHSRHSVLMIWPFLVCLFILAGCSAFSSPVRHLSSDVCLVMPESTTRQEVISFLGEPDQKITTADNSETWLYFKAKSSLSRKMPLVGEMLGSQNYETVTVTFDADLVKTCFYRQFNEEEFNNFITGLE
jgi:hypothetical protein